jgi:colanic acid biosynthesis protein WcaH
MHETGFRRTFTPALPPRGGRRRITRDCRRLSLVPPVRGTPFPRWTSRRGLLRCPAKMKQEPKPGQRLAPEDFDSVVRLTPLVAIDLIVRSPEGRVLVGHRRNEPAKGCFFTTGGRITKNETLAEAFRRIALAELGVEKNIEDARFVGVYEHFYRTNYNERCAFGTHYVVLAYTFISPAQDLPLPEEQHGEFAWLTEAELLCHPEVHENVKAYFRPGKGGV